MEKHLQWLLDKKNKNSTIKIKNAEMKKNDENFEKPKTQNSNENEK